MDPPLVQGMAADLHGHDVAPSLLGVQQPAQLDLGRGGEAGLQQPLPIAGDAEGADGQDAPPLGRQHGLQIFDGGGLAVGPGDAEEAQGSPCRGGRPGRRSVGPSLPSRPGRVT